MGEKKCTCEKEKQLHSWRQLIQELAREVNFTYGRKRRKSRSASAKHVQEEKLTRWWQRNGTNYGKLNRDYNETEQRKTLAREREEKLESDWQLNQALNQTLGKAKKDFTFSSRSRCAYECFKFLCSQCSIFLRTHGRLILFDFAVVQVQFFFCFALTGAKSCCRKSHTARRQRKIADLGTPKRRKLDTWWRWNRAKWGTCAAREWNWIVGATDSNVRYHEEKLTWWWQRNQTNSGTRGQWFICTHTLSCPQKSSNDLRPLLVLLFAL